MATEKLLETLIKKVDGLASDIRTNTYAFDKIENRFDRVDQRFDGIDNRLDSLDEQFAVQREQGRLLGLKIDSVASKMMEIDKRLMVVEAQLNLFEAKIGALTEEAQQIRLELNDLNEYVSVDTEARNRVGQLELRVFHLEEKLLT